VWPWNRATANFLTTAGVQDYPIAISNFGWLEAVSCQQAGVITSVVANGTSAVYQCVNNFSALANGGSGTIATVSGCTTSGLNVKQTITSATATSFTTSLSGVTVTESESGAKALAGPIMPITTVWGALTDDNALGRPSSITTQSSDESGTTFNLRLLPAPNTAYQVNLIYQEAPTPITTLGTLWGIPDQLQYIYTYFFLFIMLDYFDDTRATRYRQLAIASLLARADGLEESDRNLFLGNWLPLMAQELSKSESTTQATQARGV
jgi:hypothetical protein